MTFNLDVRNFQRKKISRGRKFQAYQETHLPEAKLMSLTCIHCTTRSKWTDDTLQQISTKILQTYQNKYDLERGNV